MLFHDLKNNPLARYRKIETSEAIESARKADAQEFWLKYHNKFTERNCPICHCNRSVALDDYIGLYPIVQCCHCSLVYVRTVPAQDMLNDYYQNARSINLLNKFYIERGTENQVSRSRLELVQSLLVERRNAKNILEIGCGNGQFLNSLRKNFTGRDLKLFGIEPNKDAAAEARANGVTVFEKYLGLGNGQASPDDTKYNLVLCFELIEHVLNPRDLFEHCFSSLAPNGCLVVTTPNVEGLGNILTGYNNYRLTTHAIAPPMHLQGFSRISLAILAEKTGFDIQFINGKSAFDTYEFIQYMEKNCVIDDFPEYYRDIYQKGADLDAVCSGVQGIVNKLNSGAAITAVFIKAEEL